MKTISKSLLKISILALFILVLTGCKNNKKNQETKIQEEAEIVTGPFQEDVDFMKAYEKDLIVLQSGKSMVAVAPRLQGRVMTSSANGFQGTSYGWINKEHYKSGKINPQINIYGGEERFWLGPEGGQYSIFFENGEDFIFANWSTPKLIDTESFNVVSRSEKEVSFNKAASLTNFSGFTFNFNIGRTVSVISEKETITLLGIETLEGVNNVGYKTNNVLRNTGEQAWSKDTGTLSIWLLGMFKHSKTTTVVVPYMQGDEKELGNIVNATYFGQVPPDRLKVSEKAIFYKGDGEERGKIGLTPQRAKDVLGSYDAENGILTIVKYNKPKHVTDYVNSMWEHQKHPYAGDVVNSYNDGPVKPGAKPLGPFYELETSSPAAFLKPNEEIIHNQYTFHFEGDKSSLEKISLATLGVTLNEIITVFK